MLCVDAGFPLLKKMQTSPSNEKDSNYSAWGNFKEWIPLPFILTQQSRLENEMVEKVYQNSEKCIHTSWFFATQTAVCVLCTLIMFGGWSFQKRDEDKNNQSWNEGHQETLTKNLIGNINKSVSLCSC